LRRDLGSQEHFEFCSGVRKAIVKISLKNPVRNGKGKRGEACTK
jgi:hypothetical protein